MEIEPKIVEVAKTPLFVKLNYFDANANEVFKCDDVKGPDGGFLLLYANRGADMQKVKVINLSRIESFEVAASLVMPDNFKSELPKRSSDPKKI